MSVKRKASHIDDGDKKTLQKSDKFEVKKKHVGFGKKILRKGEKMPKETAATRKERKIARKSLKPNFELSQQVLKIWEKLRRSKSKISKESTAELVDEFMKIVAKSDKNLIDMMFAHDTSRVVQSCLKQGSPEQKQMIYNELKNDIVRMCKNRYSKNMVWKLLKYGTPEQRDEIIHQFSGQVLKLIRKQGPASCIEYAYNIYANKLQRNFLVQQLYGNAFNVAKSSSESTLQDVFCEQPEKKKLILTNLKQCLVSLVGKQVIVHTIVHRVFNEFFIFCDDEQLRSDLIESLRDSAIHIMHTRDGAHVAMYCLWHGTAKDRKVIIKTMKEFLSKLCQEEYGHLVLLAAFDSVDDTVFIKKALILPIIKLLPEIMGNKYARKVILYLLSSRNPSHFVPETVKFLCKGDNNTHSKKPMDVRHRELCEAISPGLIDYVSTHIKDFACDRSLFVVVEAIINTAHGDILPVFHALNELLCIPFQAGFKDDNGKMHIIEDPAGHLLIKRLVSHHSDISQDRVSYATSLLDSVPEDYICSWSACNRGSQILLSLVECKEEKIAAQARSLLKKNKRILKKHQEVKSTVLLFEKLLENPVSDVN